MATTIGARHRSNADDDDDTAEILRQGARAGFSGVRTGDRPGSRAANAEDLSNRQILDGLKASKTRSLSAPGRPPMSADEPPLNNPGIAPTSRELARSVFMPGGHTDAAGSEYNQALSERRAEAVKLFDRTLSRPLGQPRVRRLRKAGPEDCGRSACRGKPSRRDRQHGRARTGVAVIAPSDCGHGSVSSAMAVLEHWREIRAFRARLRNRSAINCRAR
jgi:hypothetical protein